MKEITNSTITIHQKDFHFSRPLTYNETWFAENDKTLLDKKIKKVLEDKPDNYTSSKPYSKKK